jgi:uncharacterized coiled-coil protein SlyX
MFEAYVDPNKGWYNVPIPPKTPTKEDRIEILEWQLSERERDIKGLHDQNYELRRNANVLKRENKFLTRTLRRLEDEHHLPEHTMPWLFNSDSD